MLLFIDGMAHYGTADLGVKYTAVDTLGATLSVVHEGRTGNCIKRVGGGMNGDLEIAPFATRAGLWPKTTSGVCGFALKIDNTTRISDSYLQVQAEVPHDLIAIVEGNNHHLKVGVTQGGLFVLRGQQHTAGGGAIFLAQSIEGLQSNSWAYIECKWLIHPTAGSFELRVNTIPIMTFTGNTHQFDLVPGGLPGAGWWTSLRLLGVPGIGSAPLLTMRMCDLYVGDLEGSGNDVKDFLGDGIVATIFPNAPGLAAGWTPVDAVPNWDQVNDKPGPDGDSTYVSATTPGLRDVHQFEDIPANAIILGVHYNMLIRKEDEGTVTVKPVVGQGGAQFDGPTQGVGTIAYDRYLTQPYDVNPATGVQWTAAEINAGQWGILKVT